MCFKQPSVSHSILVGLAEAMEVSMNEDEKIDNELDWFLLDKTWEEYFNEGYEDGDEDE